MSVQRCVRVRLERLEHPTAYRQRLLESIYPAIEEATALGIVDRFYFLTEDRLALCFRLRRAVRATALRSVLQRHGIGGELAPYRAPSDAELTRLTAVTCLTRLLHEAGNPAQAHHDMMRQVRNQLGLRRALVANRR